MFDYVQLTALVCLVGLGASRAIALYRRGVHVLAIDRQRSVWEGLADLLALLLLLLWAYEVVAYAWPRPYHLIPTPLGIVLLQAAPIKVVGTLCLFFGLLVFLAALWSFADSWRIGIDRTTAGPLVTGGIFGWTRNPIYLALDLMFLGTFLVLGRAIFLLLALALIAVLHYQVRREERFLEKAYGAAYRDYCARVSRYICW